LVARFCVLGSELVRGHRPTIARFRSEVSSREFREFGAQRLHFALLARLAAVSMPQQRNSGFDGDLPAANWRGAESALCSAGTEENSANRRLGSQTLRLV